MTTGVLAGLRVLDLSHQYSGGLAACLLGDLGAEVTVVEHPAGSPMRTMLPKKQGESLWWKAVARGKRAITLDLSKPEGADLLRRLVAAADVVVENFRPGTLERWGLGPEDLGRVRDGLVVLRISGFGQTGPKRDSPGFGTVAEAMSGFAHLNGLVDGPPIFPSTTLADGTAATFGALGVLAKLVQRGATMWPGAQVVDVALFEPLFRLIPTQMLSLDQFGVAPTRPGNFLGSHGVLRNLYRTADGVYFVVSAIGHEPIRRILEAVGASDLEARVATAIASQEPEGFETFLAEADAAVKAWAGGQPWETVAERLAASGAVYQRVYDAADIARDEQFLERDDLIQVEDALLGDLLMPGVMPKFPGQPHVVSHAGAMLGQHNEEIYCGQLGLLKEELEALRSTGVI
jgi:crotonobetainyl-CoA:carnitine CoA-transferase CaiB-like acyl-CoA transferase